MRAIRITVLFVLFCGLLFAPAAAQGKDDIDLGTQVLAVGDGWGSYGAGVTGGLAADDDHIYTVTNRQELVAALDFSGPGKNLPKIIYVSGVIDANVDDNNQPLACEDCFRDGFTYEAFLAAYDPVVWGRVAPSGPLEAARLASRAAQEARVRIRVGSNTTIVGLGRTATIRGGWLDLPGSSTAKTRNIIIRNITFEDTFDCFPAWAPTDGDLGSWNALYDSISLRDTENVWIDHNAFMDKATDDRLAPIYFGVLFQRHDGLLDITNASDLVTVSWNQFVNHDKTMLIGSSDSASADHGKLRVTLHHNLFHNTGQRTPRVRFGQVHVYNVYYRFTNDPYFVYAWGVGIESMIYAENNIVITDQSIEPASLIVVYKGTMIHASGTEMNGTPGGREVDVVEAYNEAFDPDLLTEVGLTPTLFLTIDPTNRVIPLVESQSGPTNW